MEDGFSVGGSPHSSGRRGEGQMYGSAIRLLQKAFQGLVKRSEYPQHVLTG